MVYCDQDMCESKLGRLMQAFRADRPDEWTMDKFIGMAENMHKMNKELLAELKSMSKAYVNLLEAGKDRIESLGGDCDDVAYMAARDTAFVKACGVIGKFEGMKS